MTKTGMTGVSVGGDYDFLAAGVKLVSAVMKQAGKVKLAEGEKLPADVRKEHLANRMLPHIEAAQDAAADMVDFARWWQPDVVVSDPLIYAAPLAAGVVGAPLVRHLWGTATAWKVAFPGNGVSGADDPRAHWPGRLVELYAQYGVEPQDDLAVCTVDVCPASLQIPGMPNRVPVRYVPYNGADVTPEWSLEPPARPRVCVTWGTLTSAMVGEDAFLVPRILAALAGLDLEIIVAVSAADRARLREVPAGVRVVEGVPLDVILPSCAATIHQGGAGTTLTAAIYGVPQMIIAHFADQIVFCEQLARTGAGVGLKNTEADEAAIGQAARTILSQDRVRLAADELRQEMLAQPAPAEVVKTLEQLG